MTYTQQGGRRLEEGEKDRELGGNRGSLMLCVAVRPLVLPPREATASGPARTKQGVLPGPANSPPSPHLAGLGNPTPPAGLGHNHPNQPQLQPKTGLVPNHNHPNQPHPIPASHAGLDPSLPNSSPSLPNPSRSPNLSLHPSLFNLQLQPRLLPKSPASLVPQGGRLPKALSQALTQGLDGLSALVSLVGLSVPYNQNLQRGIYDKMMITIMGRVKPNAKQFTVNFVRGNDIAFHLNPRFNDGGKQAVVRNTMVGEHWGKEERHTQGGFPFMAGQSFEMKILVTFEEFKVAVNGAQLFEFKHRVRELNQIDRINILHDVTLTYVTVDTIP
ncbi:galectin-3-like [Salvelinus namaycush]|uniref:Galectin n=1 Tax=Salvelinus namaycush TaxID=8040 RepID=A0A8U0PF21_SALNM|nr:galectin-3-like [Salvelinus namaycush]